MHLGRLVDDDEISPREVCGARAFARCSLDRLAAVRAEVGRLHHADRRDAFPLKFSDGLIDQGLARNTERNALAFAERAGDDVRARQRLARAGRHLQHRALAAR